MCAAQIVTVQLRVSSNCFTSSMLVIVLAFVILLLFAQSVSAVEPPGTVVFSDDFSTGLSKWQIARGNSSMWTVTNGVLQGEVLSTSNVTELIPLPSLWSDEWRHYELEWDMRAVAGSDRNIAWGYQNAQNWYEVHFLPSFFEFARLKNQTVAWHKNGTAQLNLNTWYHLKLRTVGGSLQLFINDAQVFDYSDPNYEENLGTIALKVGTGATAPARVQFDNISVRLLEDPRNPELPVPGFLQNDRIWGSIIYDSAESWAGTEPATIARWGCALTSATMLLRYYGFTQLLDGTPLTPLSLNSWLLSQSDGYVAEGWVNWIALVRLSRLLRIEWSTPETPLPQLRYQYQSWESWENQGRAAITAEIRAGRPAILELPNHFIVANGLSSDEQDVKILDPASTKTKLSEGFAVPTSARLWQAQTGNDVLNLSYWLVIFPRGFRVKLLTSDGEVIANWWLSQDLPGSNTADGPANWLALTVPEPPAGTALKLEFAPATGDATLDAGMFPVDEFYEPYRAYSVQLYRYNAEANVVKQVLQSNMGTQPQTWEITADAVAQKLDWPSFILELNQMEERGLLAPVAAARLRQIAQFAVASNDPSVDYRYVTWFHNLFQQIKVYDTTLIHDDVNSYLQNWIDVISSGD